MYIFQEMGFGGLNYLDNLAGVDNPFQAMGSFKSLGRLLDVCEVKKYNPRWV